MRGGTYCISDCGFGGEYLLSSCRFSKKKDLQVELDLKVGRLLMIGELLVSYWVDTNSCYGKGFCKKNGYNC
jgi:hypothetical protein